MTMGVAESSKEPLPDKGLEVVNDRGRFREGERFRSQIENATSCRRISVDLCDGITDRRGWSDQRIENATHAELLHTLGGEGLVRAHGKDDLRGATQDRLKEESAASVMQNDGCAWDERTEVDILFDTYMRGSVPEACRVQIASHRHNGREIHLPDCGQDPVEEVAGLGVELGSQSYHDRSIRFRLRSRVGPYPHRTLRGREARIPHRRREGNHEAVTLVADRLAQTQFVAQALQSVADAIRTHQSAGSDHGDDNDRDTRSPAGSHRAEVQLVAHHQVHVGQLTLDRRRRLARGSAREVVGDNRQLSLDVDGRQGGDLAAELCSTIRPGHSPTKEPFGR